MVPFIIAGVGCLIGIAGATYGLDQRKKRDKAEQEKKELREEVRQLKDDLARKEARLVRLTALHGEKDQMVRDLSEEIERLRARLEELEKKAA